jgi:septal ring factor EnvC (AmiA/AmiB activator)
MEWTTQQQTLFDELRSRELAGTLTVQEQTQLAGLIQILEAEEARYLAPATDQMRAEQAALRERLQALQAENEALARLLNQQEQLVADARHWLTQFEQRHQQIQQTYTRLTGEILTATVSP